MKPEARFLKPERDEKGWGFELIICNNSEFCGKILNFNKGASFSTHMHKEKFEVFYVLKGAVSLTTIDTDNAQKTTVTLNQGDTVAIERMLPHRIEALEESQIIEFSTHSAISDSYRVEPGDSQKQK